MQATGLTLEEIYDVNGFRTCPLIGRRHRGLDKLETDPPYLFSTVVTMRER